MDRRTAGSVGRASSLVLCTTPPDIKDRSARGASSASTSLALCSRRWAGRRREIARTLVARARCQAPIELTLFACRPQAVKTRPERESFAARPLDFEALRARCSSATRRLRWAREPCARSRRGRNEDARAALERTREMLGTRARQRTPNLGGLCDPMPALAHARWPVVSSRTRT